MSTLSTESADLLDAAQLAALQADWPAVQHAAAAALQAMPSVSSHPEVAVKLLLLRSQAQHHSHQFHEALKGLDLALQLAPTCADALWLRAAVHAACGHHTASFMDLRSLESQQPTYPGLREALQTAATALAQERASRITAKVPPRRTYTHNTRRAAGGSAGICQGPSAQQQAYAVLGLQPGASMQAVRQAYKQRAAQVHPDKWVRATVEQQAEAEAQFKELGAAYQSVMDAL